MMFSRIGMAVTTVLNNFQLLRHTPDQYRGRVFATMLGHDAPAVNTLAFVTTFTRGAEWAATGNVTLPVPDGMK